jgi:molybdopterin-containing oxidoreductase family iron-sulfur binding subunit
MKKTRTSSEGIRIDRRTVLKGAALGLAGTMLPLDKANASFWEAFFQKHFREMNEAEKKKVIERLEREYEQKYKKAIKIGNEPAIPGVTGYGLDLHCIMQAVCLWMC